LAEEVFPALDFGRGGFALEAVVFPFAAFDLGAVFS